MTKYAETILLCGLFAALSSASSLSARADECFCMIHAKSDAILRGCESYKAQNDAYATAICTDPETGKTSPQTMYSEWTIIKEGAGICAPCRRQPGAAPKLVPRDGGNDPPGQTK